MNQDEARELTLRALCEVAPEADPATIDPGVPFQEQLDLDSMDVLNYVAGLEEEAGIRIPEADYRKVSTLSGCVAYLLAVGRPQERTR